MTYSGVTATAIALNPPIAAGKGYFTTNRPLISGLKKGFFHRSFLYQLTLESLEAAKAVAMIAIRQRMRANMFVEVVEVFL